MKATAEFEVVDIHDPDALALFGQKLVVVDGVETIVEMTDDEIEAHTGEKISPEYLDKKAGDP